MTDFADEAAVIEQEALAVALERQRRHAMQDVVEDTASPDCADCGEVIPLARRHARPGCARCVDCQTHAEKNRKRGVHA